MIILYSKVLNIFIYYKKINWNFNIYLYYPKICIEFSIFIEFFSIFQVKTIPELYR